MFYISRANIKENKTGLQTVSRPVEQILAFFTIGLKRGKKLCKYSIRRKNTRTFIYKIYVNSLGPYKSALVTAPAARRVNCKIGKIYFTLRVENTPQ